MRLRKLNNNAATSFGFIIPMTVIITVGFAIMAIGAYTVGEINDSLEGSYPDNIATGSLSSTYWHNSTSNVTRNVTLTAPNTVEQLGGTASTFYILPNGSAIFYNLTVNEVIVNSSSTLNKNEGFNWTVSALISAGALSNSDSYINYQWDVNDTTSRIVITTSGTYYGFGDWRTINQNNTVFLLGNITDGFSDVVDVEVVVIIITALSMAIFTVMAIGSRRGYL